MTLLACMVLLASQHTYAQDSTALINKAWMAYASDTSLTYRQIATRCDSHFAAAGFTVVPDDADNGKDRDGTRLY